MRKTQKKHEWLSSSGKIFFTSDNHFGHKNIIKYCKRPFNSVKEMNEALIQKWNEVVSPEDTVYHLGDFAFGEIDDILPRLNGKIILIRGNHDRKSTTKHFETYKAMDFHYGNYIFRLNHRPIFTSDIEDPYNDNEKYPNINLDDYDFILCGHCHNQWVTLQKNINVGVDVWDFKPISIEEIITYIEGECLIN
jgi:calcineurin-like phosphoesterase family protein